eukprot:3807733-Rhodomonas_salina.1
MQLSDGGGGLSGGSCCQAGWYRSPSVLRTHYAMSGRDRRTRVCPALTWTRTVLRARWTMSGTEVGWYLPPSVLHTR